MTAERGGRRYRSMLFLSGHHLAPMLDSPSSGADAVMFDLEDMVPVAEKATARTTIAHALAALRTERLGRFVRVNGWSTGNLLDDLLAIVVAGLDGIGLPKAESVDDVKALDRILSELERSRGLTPGSIEIIPLAEGRHEIDFGTNLTGWLHLKFPLLKAGQVVRLHFADRVFPDGVHASPIGNIAVSGGSCVSFPRMGGGHNVAGHAVGDGALMLDLSQMRGVSVDPVARTAWVEGGATWAEVDAATQAHGLATPGGLISETGVGGLTLSGGIGWMRSKHGLSIDNLNLGPADGAVVPEPATLALLLPGLVGVAAMVRRKRQA